MVLVGHMYQEATHINYSGISLLYEMIIICSAIFQFLFYKEGFSVAWMAIVIIKKMLYCYCSLLDDPSSTDLAFR